MKNLRFHYHMKLSFDSPIWEHRFTLKCMPPDNECQKIHELEMDIYPNEFVSRGHDSFGNLCIYGYAKGEHNKFYVDIKGKAQTGLRQSETAEEPHRIGFYRYQTEYTQPGEALKSFHDSVSFDAAAGNREKAVRFMDRLYRKFSYVQGVTGIHTTAEEAMRQGQGVCQDYSHILLSLCRMEHIPCRYIVGMLVGEGLSHAWVEIYEDGKWMALDPTNNLVVYEEHIKISNGRDYKDCTINQGVFYGDGKQVQEATVSVEELP